MFLEYANVIEQNASNPTEKLAEFVHEIWSKYNNWSDLAKIPYVDLSPEEQKKDIDVVIAVLTALRR
jgi:hypothetical protein